MPPKSPADDSTKAVPVSAIYFDKPVKWPGLPGAAPCLRVGGTNNLLNQNSINCETIFLYGDKFVINGQYFMPTSCASILCYEF